MRQQGQTITEFLLEEQISGIPVATDLIALLDHVQNACRYVASSAAQGALHTLERPGVLGTNIQGEKQKWLDVLANELIIENCEQSGQLSGIVSEEMEGFYKIPKWFPRGRYLLICDPLDGSSNIDINMTVGTIFSVLCAPQGSHPTVEDFLQPGSEQVAAGYALYGPASMIVMTVGNGVHGFTLNREAASFVLTHPDLRIPELAYEFAINCSNERFWESPVRRYIKECIEGKTGPRSVDFNMRWIASLVAEVHRILIRGGLFMYPRDSKDPLMAGRLRLMYEANPMAMVVEQAGGAASTGRRRILDINPESLHQRVPLILGSKAEVERLVRYHEAFDRGDDVTLEMPLFNDRSLFRTA